MTINQASKAVVLCADPDPARTSGAVLSQWTECTVAVASQLHLGRLHKKILRDLAYDLAAARVDLDVVVAVTMLDGACLGGRDSILTRSRMRYEKS